MKIGIIATIASLIGWGFLSAASYEPETRILNASYTSDGAMEKDRNLNRSIEIVYLPGNTCRIVDQSANILENYRDYVKACMDNRNLRLMIDEPPASN